MLPALKRLGYFELQTHSKWDIIGINESLEAIYQALGTLKGVPFILSRREREISIPMEEKRVRTTKSLLSIELEPQWSQRTMSAVTQGVAQQIASVNSPELRTVESVAQLPTVSEVPPYKAWTGIEDAIAWGMAELGWSEAQVQDLFDSIAPEQGKKGLAFYRAVKERQQTIKF